jgi:hypothetical protein
VLDKEVELALPVVANHEDVDVKALDVNVP